MGRLAVCGWDEGTASLLDALERRAGLRAVAVGDGRAAALVRARSATRLPCYQHVLEMLHQVEAGAVLLGRIDASAQAAVVAAARKMDLLLDGDLASPSTLRAASGAATRNGVALAVLRPRLRTPALAFAADLVATDPRWRPDVLEVSTEDDREPATALREAVALAARLIPGVPQEVVLSAGGSDTPVLSAHLRYASGALATLTVRRGPLDHRWVDLVAPAGRLHAEAVDGESHVTLEPRGGEPRTTTLDDGDLLVREAARVEAVRAGDGLDARLAPFEAAMLDALGEALESGAATAVADPTVRANLRLLPGGGASTPRRGRLHLVSA